MQYTEIIVFALVFIRVISFLGASPIFMIKGIPNLLKIAFSLMLSFLIINFVSYDPVLIPGSLIALLWAAAGECVFGLALGFITALIFQAMRMAGQLIDSQIGFAMANEFDITTSSNITLLGNLTYFIGLLVFFLIDGHHVLIQSLIQSFDIVPVIKTNMQPEAVLYVLSLFVKLFILSVKLAAPMIVTLFITDFTLGLISRTVPQLNILMLGLPIKVLVGLLVFLIVLPGLIHIFINALQGISKDINNFLRLFPLAVFFASEDKTEEPTPRKKEEAKKKGQVAKSREFISAITLFGITIMMAAYSDYGLRNMEMFLSNSLENVDKLIQGEGDIINLFIFQVLQFMKITLPAFAVALVLGVAANLVQTGFIHSTEPLKMDFKRLNPIEGFKRMFSKRAFMELLKSIANIAVIGYAVYSFMKGEIYKLFNISDMGLNSLIAVLKAIIQSELVRVTIIVCILGIIDLIYQKRAYNKELRMTKQEIKEELRQMEGDPKIKSAIRQRQRQMASRRMMHDVPKATVVVTNPTHLAIALKYEQGTDSAPICVAKGADDIALKIKQVAKDSSVPIIENKAVARMLYQKVEIGEAIPVEMYQAVAEILAVVYTLNKKVRG